MSSCANSFWGGEPATQGHGGHQSPERSYPCDDGTAWLLRPRLDSVLSLEMVFVMSPNVITSSELSVISDVNSLVYLLNRWTKG